MWAEIGRNMALFPIGIVINLTDLSARQIRYYEVHGLIHPARTRGNQRLFSFIEIERLIKIKVLLFRGSSMAEIKQIMPPGREKRNWKTLITSEFEVKVKKAAYLQLQRLLQEEFSQGDRLPQKTNLSNKRTTSL